MITAGEAGIDPGTFEKVKSVDIYSSTILE
jgi:hypothetical protein